MRQKFPLPETDKEPITEWARRLFRVLERAFEEINPTVDTGISVLWPEGIPLPDGYVLEDGAEYKVATYPGLARLLGTDTTPGNFEVPDLTGEAPAGVVYIIKT
jgi:hypothetical protein